MPSSLEHRLTILEQDFKYALEREDTLEEKVKTLEARVTYYDHMAVKWGAVTMTLLTLGSLLVMSVDKLKEKVLAWWGL